MCDELVVFEVLESDNSQETQEVKVQRRRLRDLSDPFSISDSIFIKQYRLSKPLVLSLCDELRPHYVSRSTKTSDISLERKVLITLSFYATGSYQRPIGDISAHSVAQSTVSGIINKITELLNLPQMQAKYIKFPRNAEERNENKIKFFNKYEMPGVLGCIDCTHIAIIRPCENEERYYCRKQYHSLNVQLISNADMQIISVDASFGGATHDSFIWANHPLKGHMEEISANEAIWLLGDSGYPLRRYLMTPINNAGPGTPESHYNIIHVQTRNIVERTIGLLKARFRCLLVHRVLHYSPSLAASIVNACTILHNICNSANTPVEVLTEEEIENELSRQVWEDTHQQTHTISSSSQNEELMEGLNVRHSLVSRLWSSRTPRN